MTTRGGRRGRRLAAPLFVGTTVGTLVGLTVAIVAGGSASLPPEPALARPLPDAALTSSERVGVVDRQAAAPRRIAIRAIGVSAPMVPLGLNPDRTMQVPGNTVDAGWFRPGPEPGERGAAVIAGHVDSKTGPAVFSRLGELRRGDLIRIRRADGSAVNFRVQGLERWPKVDFPAGKVFEHTRGATLRLITCSGSFDRASGHYIDNTIVYAARVPATRRVTVLVSLERWRRLPLLVRPDRLSLVSGGSLEGHQRP
ncbi:MAG TPA: class F sortase [Thermoleophilaceae bacterium]